MFLICVFFILIPAIISRFTPKTFMSIITFGLGLAGQIAALWSAIAWLGSAQVAIKIAQNGAKACGQGDFNCFSLSENLLAAQAALVAAVCLLAIWNIDNARILFGIYSNKKDHNCN